MKKEIHLRLIKRVFFAWLLALIIGLAAVITLEYKNVGHFLLESGVKESRPFALLLNSYLENPGDEQKVELKKMAGTALEQGSFILVNLLDSSKQPLFSVSRAPAETAGAAFVDKGMTVIPREQADGGWIIAHKRVYSKVAIPIFESDDNLSGYVSGIYLVSLKESQHIISRFILSMVICLVGVTVCALLCYFGFLFMNNHLIRSIGELNKTNIFLLKKIGAALAKSDCSEVSHSARALIYAMKLAEKTKLPLDQRRTLIHGAFLHDIGMLPISHASLLKEDELDEAASKEIARHPKEGAALIKKFRWLRNAEQVVRYHHEKYDGNGYPDGVKHEKIPMVARIFSIADAFDALTSQRPYRPPVSLEESLAILEQETGLQFDPVLLSAFLEIAPGLHESVTSYSPKELENEVDNLLKKYLKYK